jgi:hypothetical protein
MNDLNFEKDLLDERPTEVSQPSPLPEGMYLCIVGMPRRDKSTKKGTPFTEFPLRPIQPGRDISDEDLAEALGEDSLSDRELRVTFYETKDAIYRLDYFHQDCGIDLETDKGNRRQRNDTVVNREVWAVVKHQASNDGTRMYANVTRTLPVTEQDD